MLKTDLIFERENFSHHDFQNATFKNCHFYMCSFEHADLRDAKFIDCRFIESKALEGCSFRFANLKDASFTNCMLAMSCLTAQIVWAWSCVSAISKGQTSKVRTLLIASVTPCFSVLLLLLAATSPTVTSSECY